MANTSNETFITLSDLIVSGCGGQIVSMMCDIRKFWEYENKENGAFN